jgi:hypothetical protein
LRRRFNRLRITGIAALTRFEKPVVNIIYDIAEGGVSFLQTNESDISTDEFEMDILVFDSLTDFEYLIGHVMGRVRWKGLVFAPELKEPIWRFNVEFINLDGS